MVFSRLFVVESCVVSIKTMVGPSSLDPGLCGPAGSGLSQGLTLAVEELTRLLSWGFHGSFNGDFKGIQLRFSRDITYITNTLWRYLSGKGRSRKIIW